MSIFISIGRQITGLVCKGVQLFKPLHQVSQGQFLGDIKLVWIQNFPSPILVALWRLKNPVYSTMIVGVVGQK